MGFAYAVVIVIYFSYCNMKTQQGTQCTSKATLGLVRGTGAVDKQGVLHNLMCVFVALGIQHAMRLRHIIICCLPHSKIFSHINKGHDFRKIVIVCEV